MICAPQLAPVDKGYVKHLCGNGELRHVEAVAKAPFHEWTG